MNNIDRLKAVADKAAEEYQAAVEADKWKPWMPEKGDNIWIVGERGYPYDQLWDNDRPDMDCLAMGNVYPTESEAELASNKQKAHIRITNEALRLNEGWVPDWDNLNESKYVIRHDHKENRLFVLRGYKTQAPSDYVLKTNALSSQLIVSHEADLKIVMGVV